MTALEIVIAGFGAAVTLMVVIAMILLARSNAQPVPDEASSADLNLSRLPVDPAGASQDGHDAARVVRR